MLDVAVIVPTFNRLNLLSETVQSLRQQTLTNVEFIIVDDRSDTETAAYLDTLPRIDHRFRVVSKSDELDRGCQVSRNIGMEESNSAAVVFLDSDDLLEPDCLAHRFSLLVANPEADIVVGRQAIFSTASKMRRWVNVPKADRSDIDRLLELTHPIDVPWVNGGVMIRSRSLKNSGVRWRPEFFWDDVAFHFECVVQGLRSVWMDFAQPADSYYREHNEERYGKMLSTESGIRNTAGMLNWMKQSLEQHAQLTAARLTQLRRVLYHACVLPAIDAADFALERELRHRAIEAGLLNAGESRRIATYAAGRQAFGRTSRAAFYWNRLTEHWLLNEYFSDRRSTYGTVNVPPIAHQLSEAAN